MNAWLPFLPPNWGILELNGKLILFLIINAVDFFRTYADRTHHGKEEDILFKALESKKLTLELHRIMEELVAEHVVARKTVTALNSALTSHIAGNSAALKDIMQNLEELVTLYPKHIEKEDKHFFYPVQDYFTKEEQDAMLRDFWEFDRNMIHEKYAKVIDDMKGRLA